MQHGICKWICIAIASALLFSAGASAREIHGSLAGSSFPTPVDANSDGTTAYALNGSGKASVLGKYTVVGRSEGLPWDSSSFCSPTEIRVTYLSHAAVFTAANGELLYGVLADKPESFGCINVVDGVSFYGITDYILVGGTGRFDGATGHLTLDLSGKLILDTRGVTVGVGYEGSFDGEIFFAGFDDDD